MNLKPTFEKSKVHENMIILRNVRINYPCLFEKSKLKADKYTASIMIDKDSDAKEKLEKELIAMGRDNFGKNAITIYIQDGDDQRDIRGQKSLSPKAERFGYWYFNAASFSKPDVRDQSRRKIEDEKEGASLIYSGCYVDAFIALKPYTSKTGVRSFSFDLVGVQKRADADRFSNVISYDVSDEAIDYSDENQESQSSFY